MSTQVLTLRNLSLTSHAGTGNAVHTIRKTGSVKEVSAWSPSKRELCDKESGRENKVKASEIKKKKCKVFIARMLGLLSLICLQIIIGRKEVKSRLRIVGGIDDLHKLVQEGDVGNTVDARFFVVRHLKYLTLQRIFL